MIALRSFIFRKVTIVGVGLIGGSLALAMKKHKLAKEIVGVSQKQSTLEWALKNQVIDQACPDVKKAVTNADLVVLATPVGVISAMMSTIAPHIRRNCIVTDVGSTKTSIVNAAQSFLPNKTLFVGSHPLAGSEKRGVEHATADLFANSLCLLTATANTSRGAVARVKTMWTTVGCRVKSISCEEHDQVMAYISHLPHVLAYSLMEVVPTEYFEYAAQGLKDTTRVAGSSPQMWQEICLANGKNIIQSIDQVVGVLSTLRKAMAAGDQKILLDHFTNAKNRRDKLV